MAMNLRTALLVGLSFFVFLPSTSAQKFEITGHVGYQFNGGLDLSTSLFHRIEVVDSANYGATAGFLFGNLYGVEFQWNHTRADTFAQPVGGGQDIKVFKLNQNQYMGNFLFHFASQ